MTNLEVNSIDAFSCIWFCWQILGMKPFRNYRIAYHLYTVVIHIVFGLLCPITLIAYLILKEPNSHSVITNFAYILSLIAASAKHIIIWIMSKRLLNGNVLLNKLDIAASYQKDEQNYLKKTIKSIRNIFIGYSVLFSIAGSVFVLAALSAHKLMFEVWTPYDWNDYYIETISHQALTLVYAVIQNLSSDVYAPSYILIVTAHMRTLRMRLAKITKNTDADDHYNKSNENLVNCIKDHQTITEFFRLIEPVIAMTILVQFMITAFVICTTALTMIVFGSTLSQFFGALSFLLALVSEVFPVCYCADILRSETHKLTNAIFQCNWIGQTQAFQKTLIIFMQRSQINRPILAGHLVPINLDSLQQIFKFSFSLFTILSQVGN